MYVGAILVQRTKMVRKANGVISGIRSNCHSSCDVDKIIGFNDDNVSIDHESPTILQMKLTAIQVMFDLYKLISIELHRGNEVNFFSCCPTCTNGHLMKEEYQTLIDSVRESVLMKNVMCSKDPLRHKHMSMGGVVFVENQTGIGRDFISSFVMQSDLSRLSSDCDLVPHCLRHQKSGGSMELSQE